MLECGAAEDHGRHEPSADYVPKIQRAVAALLRGTAVEKHHITHVAWVRLGFSPYVTVKRLAETDGSYVHETHVSGCFGRLMVPSDPPSE